MPVQWTNSHPKRLVVAVAKGEVRPRAMVDFLARLDAAGARPYAKLVFLERYYWPFLARCCSRHSHGGIHRWPCTPSFAVAASRSSGAYRWLNWPNDHAQPAATIKACRSSSPPAVPAPAETFS